jgi:hypothetical protein
MKAAYDTVPRARLWAKLKEDKGNRNITGVF